MQKELLKVALIGVGSVGKKYARMITAGEVQHMKLSAVVIRRDELIEWGESLVNTDGDNARIFRSAEELFETGESCYDAVIIATPHKTHKELALKAFAKGKAVLCDKPAAADIGEALAMQKAASESGRIYGMIFHQRLYPKYIRIKQMIDNGELGDIKRVCLINSRYLRTSYYHNLAHGEAALQVKAVEHLSIRDSIFLICISTCLECHRSFLQRFHLENTTTL